MRRREGEGKREPVNAEVRVVCKGKSSEETCIMEEAKNGHFESTQGKLLKHIIPNQRDRGVNLRHISREWPSNQINVDLMPSSVPFGL